MFCGDSHNISVQNEKAKFVDQIDSNNKNEAKNIHKCKIKMICSLSVSRPLPVAYTRV